MKAIICAATIGALASTNVGAAHAAKLCRLNGAYNDEYGVAVAHIKGMHGQLVAPKVCATPYNFKVTNETQTGFTVTGGNKTKSCGGFATMATFMGSCDVFGGTVTLKGQQYSDVFTKQAQTRAAPSRDAGLSRGLK